MSANTKRLTGAALYGLDVIGTIASKATSGKTTDTAVAALKATSAIVLAIQEGFAREINPAEVLKLIDLAQAELDTSLASNDQAANAALDKRFPR